MEDKKPEEKAPLLLYVVDGAEDVSKTNKRVTFENKGRLYGISSGATAIFADFPNYLSPCWVTALLSGIMFFMMVLLMISSVGPTEPRVPRCPRSTPEELSNTTVHLVHSSKNWTKTQLEVLIKIKEEYRDYNVHLVVIRENSPKINIMKINKATAKPNISANNVIVDNQKLISLKPWRKTQSYHKRDNKYMDSFASMKNLLNIILKSKLEKKVVNDSPNEVQEFLTFTELLPPSTATPILEDIISDFPRLSFKNITLDEAFANTPLQNTWRRFNEELAIFGIRVLHLWQYGGLSFSLDEVDSMDWDAFSRTHEMMHPFESWLKPQDRLEKFVATGRISFERMPKEVVTADDEGLHIFTKSPCHVFFGEILMHLKRARGNETPKYIIQKSLRVFCRHSAVGKNYCKNLIRRSV